MKWFLLLLVLLLLPMVSAGLSYKPLVNVSNCFNLTIDVLSVEGRNGPLGFYKCSEVESNRFFCDCYSSSNVPFVLYMRSDDGILRNSVDYVFKLRVTSFSFGKESVRLSVSDWGDYAELNGDVPSDLGNRSVKPEFIFVNRTVFVNQTIYQDKLVYRDREVKVVEVRNVTFEKNVSWENVSRIVELEGLLRRKENESLNCSNTLSTMSADYNNKLFWVFCVVAFSLIAITAIAVYSYNKDKKEEDKGEKSE